MAQLPITREEPRLVYVSVYDELLDRYRMEKIVDRRNESIGPREAKTLLEEYVAGFLVFVVLETDNPDVWVLVDLYGDGSLDIQLSPRYLYTLGATSPNASGAWLSRYDDTEKKYVAWYTPSPWIPFKGFTRIKIMNSSLSDATFSFTAWVLRKRQVARIVE